MNKAIDILKQYFGHVNFREGQEQIVNCLLSGRDVLCIMPTGAGKSICYQVPALIFDGITIVISPLISLMKDQVNALCQSGIPAAYLNSSLSQSQYISAIQNVKNGKYKIIYVAPERIGTTEFAECISKIKISMIAVDEAHCVSQWGQDFRPSYLAISNFIYSLPCRPVIGAFTATATNKVKNDINNILQLNSPFSITTGFDRPNLFFSVINTNTKLKNLKLLELISERKEQSGIVYCATRKLVEEVCSLLNNNGYSATRYHAGLTEIERKNNQDDFVYDRCFIMVATNAFGMGIDKSNVSFVIHYNMPKDVESYYQEAGRAGRDGEDAECIVLYSPQDVRINQLIIKNTNPKSQLSKQEQEEIHLQDVERLKHMTFYCTTNDCLRNYILKYFGENSTAYCGKCSNCLTKFVTADITVDAQKILSCIVKTRQRFGKKMICDVLRGSKNERLMSLKLNKQSTYGIMKDSSEKYIRAILDYLIEHNYIELTSSDYPLCKCTPLSNEILKGNLTLKMKIAEERINQSKKSNGFDESPLLGALKNLRREIASEQGVPAYVIFSDSTLFNMCRNQPKTEAELLKVPGVGAVKLEKYGQKFLQVIKTSDKPKK